MANPAEQMERVGVLLKNGERDEAREYLFKLCDEYTDVTFILSNAAIIMFNEQWFDERTLSVIDRALAYDGKNADLWFMYAHTSYIAHCENRDEGRGIAAAIRALTINPQHVQSYATLINIYLMQGREWEAYMAHATMMKHLGAAHDMVMRFRGLCEFVSNPRHRPHIGFIVDGEGLVYTSETRTPQGVLATLNHANSKVIDIDVLRFALEFAGPVKSVLEVGCLAGNHAAYLLRFMKPDRYLGVDGVPDHVAITRQTVFLNKVVGLDGRAEVVNAVPGSSEGMVRLYGQDVPRRKVDDIAEDGASGAWDFIRFDVKSDLMDALQGAERILTPAGRKLMLKVGQGLGGQALDWLTSRGYRLVNSMTHDGEDNHFLTNGAG